MEMLKIWTSLPYQNVILIGVVTILLGIILILAETKEKLTKLKAITSLCLYAAVASIFVYIVFNSWTIPTGILMVVVIAVSVLIQNIMIRKEAEQKKKLQKNKN